MNIRIFEKLERLEITVIFISRVSQNTKQRSRDSLIKTTKMGNE
jgi:hypothetical protein